MSAAMTNSMFVLFPILLANVLFNTGMPKTHLSHSTDLVSFRRNYIFIIKLSITLRDL